MARKTKAQYDTPTVRKISPRSCALCTDGDNDLSIKCSRCITGVKDGFKRLGDAALKKRGFIVEGKDILCAR
jgi:hypothetical protein